MFEVNLRKKVFETPCQPMAECGDMHLSSQHCGEAQMEGSWSKSAWA
jgi:hypothetical protein